MAEKTEDNEKEEFVPPDGGYGWVIVVAIILINVSSFLFWLIHQ